MTRSMRRLISFSTIAVFAVISVSAGLTAPQGGSQSIPDPQTTEEIKPRFAEASSVLIPQLGKRDRNYFAPRKVMDGLWETCWAEAAEDEGIGEWIKLVWLTPEVPTHVGVVPGWAKTKARWKNNPRLKTAEVILSNGFVQTVNFHDKMQLQFIQLKNTQPAGWMKLVVREVYPGERFEDTSISEIKIFKRKTP